MVTLQFSVGDVAVLENNADILKLLIQVLDHLAGHLTFEIEHLTQPDPVYECAYALIDLSV